MTATWAYIYEHPDTDPIDDRVMIDRSGQRTLLVPVATTEKAPEVARRLASDDEVTMIELCGGFSLAAAAAVATAVPDHVAVGHVTYSADSLAAAHDYAVAASE